ncbi:hypothetical protein, partial [Photobacterium sp. 1_MG-2023]|uniref:hypothetical protein n=1 Tax=Photobacterium sp. 1_MG-2023 TaxID=3062646 RepID=UPI0026E11F06
TGVMEPANAFFNDIRRAIDTDNDGQLSENELIAFYQSATNKLEKVIAKHPSEWHFEEQVDNAWFNQVLEKGRVLLEQHASKYFQSEAIFQESAYREKIMSLYDDFIDHEKARIEQTAWMQQLDTEKLEIQPQVWHFWPLGIYMGSICPIKPTCDIENYYEIDTNKGTFTLSNRLFEYILNIESYASKPYFAGGLSGITIGYGYDLGYQNESTVRRELNGLYSNDDIDSLVAVIGKTSVDAVRSLSNVSNIEISKDNAKTLAVRMKLRYSDRVVRIYPEAINLHPDCQGALLSLVINRGSSLSGERRSEMKNIQTHLKNKRYDLIAGEIRSMKRLWRANQSGLLKRREYEAKVFDDYYKCKCWVKNEN